MLLDLRRKRSVHFHVQQTAKGNDVAKKLLIIKKSPWQPNSPEAEIQTLLKCK